MNKEYLQETAYMLAECIPVYLVAMIAVRHSFSLANQDPIMGVIAILIWIILMRIVLQGVMPQIGTAWAVVRRQAAYKIMVFVFLGSMLATLTFSLSTWLLCLLMILVNGVAFYFNARHRYEIFPQSQREFMKSSNKAQKKRSPPR